MNIMMNIFNTLMNHILVILTLKGLIIFKSIIKKILSLVLFMKKEGNKIC